MASNRKTFALTYASPSFHAKAQSVLTGTPRFKKTQSTFYPKLNDNNGYCNTQSNYIINSCLTNSTIKSQNTPRHARTIDYDKFFFRDRIPAHKKRMISIDNRLNLMYSDNVEQFKKNLRKKDPEKAFLNEKAVENVKGQISQCKKEIFFIKKVVDFTYPKIVMAKNKREKLKRMKIKPICIYDFKQADENVKQQEKNKLMFIYQSFDIKKIHF